MINKYLEKIKKHITTKGFDFAGNREKNANFIEEYGFKIEDIKDILLDLNKDHHIGGPESDHNLKFSGNVWKFRYDLEIDKDFIINIYIKIRYNPPEELVCISFHEDELFEQEVFKMNKETRKVYCEKCNKKVDYDIISEIKKEYKGVEVNIEQNIGICSECGERLYVTELEEINLDKLYSRYRELTGIVTPQDIINFREKYNISQRELVAILDWGKMTINRYERGSLPNQSHSDILKLIIKEESYFREKVEDAYKNGRISEKTYNNMHFSMDQEKTSILEKLIELRLSNEVNIYNGFKKFDLDRLENLIGYISSKVNNLYKTSLNKYLWYIDFSNYKYNLKSITGLRYMRYTFGPIIEDMDYELILNLKNKFEKEVTESYRSEITKIKSKDNYDISMFSDKEMEIIDRVIEVFKDKNVGEISDLSHKEKAWIETKDKELISYEYAHDLKYI